MTFPDREQCVVGALLQKQASERPDAPFLEFADGDIWTFAETLERVRRSASGLQQLGVQRGAHVLSWLPNGKEAILTWFGANFLGAVYVPVNTALPWSPA